MLTVLSSAVVFAHFTQKDAVIPTVRWNRPKIAGVSGQTFEYMVPGDKDGEISASQHLTTSISRSLHLTISLSMVKGSGQVSDPCSIFDLPAFPLLFPSRCPFLLLLVLLPLVLFFLRSLSIYIYFFLSACCIVAFFWLLPIMQTPYKGHSY